MEQLLWQNMLFRYPFLPQKEQHAGEGSEICGTVKMSCSDGTAIGGGSEMHGDSKTKCPHCANLLAFRLYSWQPSVDLYDQRCLAEIILEFAFVQRCMFVAHVHQPIANSAFNFFSAVTCLSLLKKINYNIKHRRQVPLLFGLGRVQMSFHMFGCFLVCFFFFCYVCHFLGGNKNQHHKTCSLDYFAAFEKGAK